MNITASSQFNIKRLGATLRRDWAMERGGWAVRVLAMFGVMTVILIAGSWFVHSVISADGFNDFSAMNKFESKFIAFTGWFFFSIFTTLGASHFYQGYATPGQRLNQLMNPASTLEKYTSRFIICIVGVGVATIICWELADMLRMWLLGVYYGKPVASHIGFFSSVQILSSVIDSPFFTVGSLFMSQATYVLGSTFWPKHSFLKTLGAMTVLQFIYGFAAGSAVSWFFDFENIHGSNRDISVNSFSDIGWVMTAFLTVMALFCYITAYFRMREDEIIQRM